MATKTFHTCLIIVPGQQVQPTVVLAISDHPGIKRTNGDNLKLHRIMQRKILGKKIALNYCNTDQKNRVK